MRDGVININKPAGWTSQDVCAKLRSRLHIKKIGHTGTLDPMATGVLPVCIGKASRIIEYYDKDIKSYHASMRLGIATDTLDISGEVLSEVPAEEIRVTEKEIREAFESYKGVIAQVPPKYSALKVNGKRAYDLARQGADFELKAREVTIYKNDIARIDLAAKEIEFDVSCSKGTYIRSICDDIGRALGCGAVMTALARTGSGCFILDSAVDIKELVSMTDEEIEGLIVPADETLTMLGTAELRSDRAKAFRNGNSSWLSHCRITEKTRFDNIYKVYSDGSFLGIAAAEGDALVPLKVFN
ncbi:MAG: tRNA pseudouridine(55) synthase TruB [Mogibacterium sp.]|nr:tRNA pseudouridine(55) synthase TruB [Mogibacterium sp.]